MLQSILEECMEAFQKSKNKLSLYDFVWSLHLTIVFFILSTWNYKFKLTILTLHLAILKKNKEFENRNNRDAIIVFL